MNYDMILVMVPPWEPKMPPLGLAYICEYLKSKGLRPKVIDLNLKLFREASLQKSVFWDINNINSMSPHEVASGMFDSFTEEIDAFVNQLISFDCDLIGFSVNIASIGLAGKIATLIKKRDSNKKVIFGGTGCFWENDRGLIFPEDLGSIDAFVIGDGEETSEAIIDNHRNGKSFKDISGVICRKNDFLKRAAPFYTQDIDKLPFPTFIDFDLNLYKEKTIPMLISRGCIGRCVFCIDHLMCGRYRFRSPGAILKEIQYHVAVNKARNFGLCDLICNGNLKQLEELCDLLIRSGVNITWGDYAMVRKDMTLGLLKKMRKAGCALLCYGVESACDRTLKRMNKFYSSKDAERVIRLTDEAGIAAAINIIVGFPQETEADFEETVSFIKRNKEYIYEVTNVSAFVIMSPSKLGTSPEEYGIRLPLPKQFNFSYVDKNGMDFRERARRVRKTIFVTNNAGIKNVIVNYYLKEHHDASSVALVFSPVWRVDILPQGLAYLSGHLHKRGFSVFAHDLNIRLYRAATAANKVLWDQQNRHLWSLPEGLSDIFERLEGPLAEAADQLACLRTNRFCFLIEKENLIFSLRMAAILRKYNPNITIIFSSHGLNSSLIKQLTPPGAVDFFVSSGEESMLENILTNLFNNGVRRTEAAIHKEAERSRGDLVIDLKETGLASSDYSRLPLRWREKDKCRIDAGI